MEGKFSIIGNLRNDRIDGEDRKVVPRHEDVPKTVYLDVYDLIIDKSEVVKGENLPSIGQMMKELLPKI